MLEELTDLESFLKKKYDDEICQLFISTFKDLRFFYPLHQLNDKADYNIFEQRYIELIKGSKIVFLDDINKDKYLLKNISSKENYYSLGGYIERNNRLIFSENKPEKISNIRGYAQYDQRKITILYDDFAINNQSISDFEFLIIHELTHLTQSGFELPWFIAGRNHFLKTLSEGHAIKKGNYINDLKYGSSTIPYNYDININQYTNYADTYNIYNYLYFKLETLLGEPFMEEWATTPKDFNFLTKSKIIMDNKYGEGFSSKFFQNMQVLILDIDKNSKDKIKELLNEYQSIYSTEKDFEFFSKEEIEKKYIKIYKENKAFLTDPNLFRQSYEEAKKEVLNPKEYSKERHIIYLKKKLGSIYNELYMINHQKEKEEIILSGINAYKEILNNPNYINDAITNIESLVIDALMIDVNKNEDNIIDKADDYLFKVGLLDITNLSMKDNLEKAKELETMLNEKENKSINKR